MGKSIVMSLWLGLILALLHLNPVAAQEDHKALAMEHALAAVESGKQGNAAAVGEHAGAAKTHAEAAQQERANPHLEAAIKNLNSAIEHAKMGHADLAGESAEAAVTHLEAAKKSF